MDLFRELIDEIKRNNASHCGFLEKALAQLTPEEEEALTKYVAFLVADGKPVPYVAECYDTLVRNVNGEQLYFSRNQRYRYSTFAEVESKVYFNDNFMEKYMIGLGISTFLWPQHLKMHRFFLDTLPRTAPGSYLEIGPGHGFYFMTAMKNAQYSFFEGVDISPKSILLTRSIIASGLFGTFSNYSIVQADFTQFNTEKTYDAIVMGEVLEHVEDPLSLMRKLYALANARSYVFVTTVINAPVVDHIYLFDSPDSIKQLVSRSGFEMKEMLLAPANERLSIEKNMERKFPVDVAMVLSRN